MTIADRNEWLAQAGAVNLPSRNAFLLGDANLDGFVDGRDFVEWNFNKFTTSSAWTDGDFNADGVVDGPDFVFWNDNKFQSADGSTRRPFTPSLLLSGSKSPRVTAGSLSYSATKMRAAGGFVTHTLPTSTPLFGLMKL